MQTRRDLKGRGIEGVDIYTCLDGTYFIFFLVALETCRYPMENCELKA